MRVYEDDFSSLPVLPFLIRGAELFDQRSSVVQILLDVGSNLRQKPLGFDISGIDFRKLLRQSHALSSSLQVVGLAGLCRKLRNR